MIMSKGNFEAAMTGRTQRHEIVEQVGFILKFMESPAVNMVNIKRSTARAALRPAIEAHLVALQHLFANRLPISSVRQFLSATPVRAVFAHHVLNRTLARTVPSPVFGGGFEHLKVPVAVLASQRNPRDPAGIGTLWRTVANCWRLLMKAPSAMLAIAKGHLRPSLCSMTPPGTKVMLFTLEAVRRALECLSAMVTHHRNTLSDCVNGTLARTVIDRALICFEPLTTLEARFDHR